MPKFTFKMVLCSSFLVFITVENKFLTLFFPPLTRTIIMQNIKAVIARWLAASGSTRYIIMSRVSCNLSRNCSTKQQSRSGRDNRDFPFSSPRLFRSTLIGTWKHFLIVSLFLFVLFLFPSYITLCHNQKTNEFNN